MYRDDEIKKRLDEFAYRIQVLFDDREHTASRINELAVRIDRSKGLGRSLVTLAVFAGVALVGRGCAEMRRVDMESERIYETEHLRVCRDVCAASQLRGGEWMDLPGDGLGTLCVCGGDGHAVVIGRD